MLPIELYDWFIRVFDCSIRVFWLLIRKVHVPPVSNTVRIWRHYNMAFIFVCIYRLELQVSKPSDENTSSYASVKLSQLGESKDPTYDAIDTTKRSQDVKMVPNPAYGTASIKMDENPAYR